MELALPAPITSGDPNLEIGDRHRTRRRGSGSDAGAAMVEMAFILVLLLMLLVGTVTAAIALGRDNSIQNAAREASRFGATLPDYEKDLTGWFTDVIGVARAAALGDLDPSVANAEICVAFITDKDVATHAIDPGVPPVDGNGICPGFVDGRSGEARVNVVVQRDTPFNVILWSTDITLTAKAGARYERSP